MREDAIKKRRNGIRNAPLPHDGSKARGRRSRKPARQPEPHKKTARIRGSPGQVKPVRPLPKMRTGKGESAVFCYATSVSFSVRTFFRAIALTMTVNTIVSIAPISHATGLTLRSNWTAESSSVRTMI